MENVLFSKGTKNNFDLFLILFSSFGDQAKGVIARRDGGKMDWVKMDQFMGGIKAILLEVITL